MMSDESEDYDDYEIAPIPMPKQDPIYKQIPTQPQPQQIYPVYPPYWPTAPQYYVQTPSMIVPQAQFNSFPKLKSKQQSQAKKQNEKEEKNLSRGERHFILSAFNKELLMVMRLGGRRVIGASKNQLVQTAVDMTKTRDDVLNLILSAYDGISED